MYAWSRRWETYKVKIASKGMWQDASGKLRNLEKKFVLNLSAESLREGLHLQDENGFSYSGIAMIRISMAMNINNLWEETQLFSRLQEIIKNTKITLKEKKLNPHNKNSALCFFKIPV